jgi:hypothetical protein
MVSLDDLVEAEKKGPAQCRVCLWLEQLPPNVQESFARHLDAGTKVAPLWRACQQLDPPVPVGYIMFSKHVNGSCRHH